jgi:glycine/D-amino acid oxidase-like deaminating enzyme
VSLPSQNLPRAAECVIVGGGVVGVSLAFRLAQAGMKPLLLERDALGGGSTGRCAGGIRQQFSTEVNVRVGMMSKRLLEQFEEETGRDPAFRQIGYLFLADDAAQAHAFAANVEMQHRLGLAEVRLMNAGEVAELVPELRVDDVAAATFCPSDGLAGPNEVTMGYAAAAQASGAVIVENCSARKVLVANDHVCGIETDAGAISSDLVVNCAGPYAAQIAQSAHIEVPVLPYRRHIFVTEECPVSAGAPMIVDFHTSFYMHPEGPGLLLGMSDRSEPSSYDTTVSWEFLERLTVAAARRLPAIEQARIKTGWAGLYEISPDNQAIVGPSELAGFWLCCGFSGHGFMQAPAMGLLLSQMITGVPTDFDISAFAPDRFTGAPLSPESAVI